MILRSLECSYSNCVTPNGKHAHIISEAHKYLQPRMDEMEAWDWEDFQPQGECMKSKRPPPHFPPPGHFFHSTECGGLGGRLVDHRLFYWSTIIPAHLCTYK